MIIATRYTVKYDKFTETYQIDNMKAPLCPDCGQLLSGYDSRRRHVVDASGNTRWFLLRRLRCPGCRSLHLELPDFMRPQKHYEAQLIDDALAGLANACPADNSTIWRWRSENHPPGLQCLLHGDVIQSRHSEKEGDKP